MNTVQKPPEAKGERITILTRKDCDISYFIGSGAGGQNRQKNATGVQIIHRASSAMGRCSETRSRIQNQKKAFRNLTETPKFKVWLARTMYQIQQGETVEQAVAREMLPHNLVMEVRNELGKLVEMPVDAPLPN